MQPNALVMKSRYLRNDRVCLNSRIKNFSDAFATLVADADRFYVLSFDSLPSKAPDEFRSIEVKVNRPDVTVRTSTGYYAQP